ncbi:MAG: hypothetical protein ACOCXA_08930 [Planctomycetota bacterium]
MYEDITHFAFELGRFNPTQRELEALVAVLALIMHADDRIRLGEVAFIDRIEEGCDWQGHMGLAQYVAKKRSEAISALRSEAKLDDYIARAAAKLDSPDIQKPVYLLADELANADHEVSPEEMRILEKLVEAFRD